MAQAPVDHSQSKQRRTAPLLPTKPKKPKVAKQIKPHPKPEAPLTLWQRLAKTSSFKRLHKLTKQPTFRKYYVVGSLTILTLTTILWAFLGARLQQTNADQLANAYLFEDKATFKGEQLPSQHSFLIKWPVWLLIKLGGYSSGAFEAMTVLVALLTIGFLAYCMYRIERRPLVFGSLVLALASVLLMVPVQPYAGALLPVSMAMVTTRNLEYVVYIVALILIFKAGRLKQYAPLLAVVLMSLLIASDHLFLSLIIGSSVLVLFGSYLLPNTLRRAQGLRMLGLGVLSTIIAEGITRVLINLQVLHTAGANGAAPYSVTTNPKDVVLGIWYGLTGGLSTVGANPVSNAVELKQIPAEFLHKFASLGAVPYIVNIAIVGLGLLALRQLIKTSKVSKKEHNLSTELSIALVATVAAAFLLFIGSKHYYAVDARYLGIVPFALFILLATGGRKIKWQAPIVVAFGCVLAISCVFGSLQSIVSYHAAANAQAPLTTRNQKVLQALRNHPVDTLVGDYWRTYPIKQASHGDTPIIPLENCTMPRQVLTSEHWNIDLKTHRFAYLLSLDKGLTDYPACSLQQVAQAYGRPNSSTLIAGTLRNPKELLLFYDSGTKPSSTSEATSILPVDLSSMGNLTCTGATIMNVVAHQDDDLLFMNPDLLHSLQEGDCVRTIYVTAGDSGSKEAYWLSREQGSEAAYASMLGIKNEWIQQVVQLGDDQYITIASPKNATNVSLVFMRLPDGNLDGHGFAHTKHQSLARLYNGEVKTMRSVDGQSTYNRQALRHTLSTLMEAYKPGEVRTQSSLFGTEFTDHSDHMSTSAFGKEAFEDYVNKSDGATLAFYMGYPVREQNQNVEGYDLTAKQAAFFAYAAHDASVCGTEEQCAEIPTYGSYLLRQYRVDK